LGTKGQLLTLLILKYNSRRPGLRNMILNVCRIF